MPVLTMASGRVAGEVERGTVFLFLLDPLNFCFLIGFSAVFCVDVIQEFLLFYWCRYPPSPVFPPLFIWTNGSGVRWVECVGDGEVDGDCCSRHGFLM